MADVIQKIEFSQPLQGVEKPQRKLRIGWTSNPPWTPSGYSQQTADIERKFVESGWNTSNLALINMFGQHGGRFKDQYGIWNYPIIGHPTGSDAMAFHGRHFKTDAIFGLFDIWTQDPGLLQQIPRFIPWVPVDYYPVPGQILNILRFSNRIIAMSKFGQKALQENGFASTYIPHHVDTDIFYPTDKKKRRAEVGLPPDMFIFGMISANKDILPRKSFGQVLEAYAQFVKKYPNSLLYIHTNPDQQNGYQIKHHANMLGIGQHLMFPDPYKWQFDTSKQEMNNIYNTFDCLLSPSSTEGFCIPVIEAQACGIPVIVNDYTSMPELIIEGETGYVTRIGCEHLMPIGSFMKFPDPEDLYQKMLRIKGMKLEIMGEAARKHAVKNYSLEHVWSMYWLPYLERLEQEVYPAPLTTK